MILYFFRLILKYAFLEQRKDSENHTKGTFLIKK